MNGRDVTAILDTGADFSIMDYELYLSLEQRPKLETPECRNIETANGSNEGCLGQTKVSFRINNNEFLYEGHFHVLRKVPAKILLGQDFIDKYKVKIDAEEKACHTKVGQRVRVNAIEDITIPPRVQWVGKFQPSTTVPEGSLAMCTGSQTIINLGIVPGKCLININHDHDTVPVVLVNPTDKPIKIKQGTRVGQLEILHSEADITCIGEGTQTGEGRACNQVRPSSNQPRPNVTEKELQEALDLHKGNLSVMEKQDLLQVLSAYRDVFALSTQDLGCATSIKHRIITEPGVVPIKSRPYRVRPQERAIIEEQIQDMLSNDIIRPSTSPWSAPVVLVKKHNGSMRFCVDFRRLNMVSKSDNYPLPRIDDTLDSLGMSQPQYFSTLDLMSGYHQVELEVDSKEKTAFVTHAGLFEFQKMPFGLKSAPATFQRLMENTLRGLNWKSCLIY